jgi:hypothetical protein
MVKFNIKVEFNEQSKGVTANTKIEAIDCTPEEYARTMELIMADNKMLFEWAYAKSKAWGLTK